MSPDGLSGSPTEGASPVPQGAPSQARKSKVPWIAIGVVVVVVVLILALVAAGAIPGSNTSAANLSTYTVTFSQTGLPADDAWGVACSLTVGGHAYQFSQSTVGATTEFAVPNGQYSCAIESSVTGIGASMQSKNVTVDGAAVTVPIAFVPVYPITFSESGLGSPDYFQVTVNGSTYGALPNATIYEPNGTYPFNVSAYGFVGSPFSGRITVQGSGVSQLITFSQLPKYDVTVNESGLPTGTPWRIFMEGGANGTRTGGSQQLDAPIGYSLALYPGTYHFSISSLLNYSISPQSGNVTVTNADVMLRINFALAPTFAVTFTETGVPTGASWQVSLNDSYFPGAYSYTTAPGANVIMAPAGSYPFLAVAQNLSTVSGAITVSTHPMTVPVVFSQLPPTPPIVTITETGLSLGVGVRWWITVQPTPDLYTLPPFPPYGCLNETFITGSGPSSLGCQLVDGYYTWTAGTNAANFTASPMTGGLWVDGSNVTIQTSFLNTSSKYLFSIGWQEAPPPSTSGGLAPGTTWGATVNGAASTTTGSALSYLEANNNRTDYSVSAPAGYVSVPSSGSLTGVSTPLQGGSLYSGLFVLVVFLPQSLVPAVIHSAAAWETSPFDPLLPSGRGR